MMKTSATNIADRRRVRRPIALVLVERCPDAGVTFWLLGLLLAGCAAGPRLPVDGAHVAEALLPLSPAALVVAADSLSHPLLDPVAVDLDDGISPDEAAVIAVLANPALRAVRDERALAQAQVLQAGILPNPTLDASVDVPTGGATAGSVTGHAIGLQWDLLSLIRRPARVRAAEHNRAAVDLEIAWQEWSIAQDARLAVWRLSTLEQQLGLDAQADSALSLDLDLVRQAVAEGIRTELELAASESARNRSHANRLALAQQAAEQRLHLSRILGLPADSTLRVQQGTRTPVRFTPPPLADMTAGLALRRLDIAALRRGYESEDATLRAAILQGFPTIMLGANSVRDTGDLRSTGGTLSIEIPIFDRNQGDIALQRATRQQLYDAYVGRLHEARSDLALLVTTIDALDARIEASEQSEMGLQRLVEIYRDAVQRGEADVLSFYTAWADWNDQRVETLGLRQELQEARIALDIASGRYRPDDASADPPNEHARDGD